LHFWHKKIFNQFLQVTRELRKTMYLQINQQTLGSQRAYRVFFPTFSSCKNFDCDVYNGSFAFCNFTPFRLSQNASITVFNFAAAVFLCFLSHCPTSAGAV